MTLLVSHTFDSLHSLSDVNECEDNLHHCTELCINLPGSYICSCPDGFTLEEDGISCRGIYDDCYLNC